MITLEQIQILDKKIKDAIDLINRLRDDKRKLQEVIADHEVSIALLEEELLSCKNNSDQIEEGFNDVLSQLDMVDSTSAQPGQQEQAQMKIQLQTDFEEEGIEEDSDVETDSEEEPQREFTLDAEAEDDSEKDESPDITEEAFQENMQFEVSEDEISEDPASEEPDIDKGIPLTPDATIIEEESQVNHLEQQEDEDSRSPQDLDIF